MFGLGDAMPITSCPQCSILVEGSCVVCQTGQAHPSCTDCVDGAFKPPWYKSPLTNAVVTAVVVSVLSGLLLKHLSRKFHV